MSPWKTCHRWESWGRVVLMDDEAMKAVPGSTPGVRSEPKVESGSGDESGDAFDVEKFNDEVQGMVEALIMATRIIRTLALRAAPFDEAVEAVIMQSRLLDSMSPALRGAVISELIIRADDWEPTLAAKDGES